MTNTTELPEKEGKSLPFSISTKDLAADAKSGDKKALASLAAEVENGFRNPIVVRDDPFDLRPRGLPRNVALALANTDAWACLVVNRLLLPEVDLGWWDDNLAEEMGCRAEAGERRRLIIFATAAGVDEWIAFLTFHNPDMPIALVDGKDRGRIVRDGDSKRKG